MSRKPLLLVCPPSFLRASFCRSLAFSFPPSKLRRPPPLPLPSPFPPRDQPTAPFPPPLLFPHPRAHLFPHAAVPCSPPPPPPTPLPTSTPLSLLPLPALFTVTRRLFPPFLPPLRTVPPLLCFVAPPPPPSSPLNLSQTKPHFLPPPSPFPFFDIQMSKTIAPISPSTTGAVPLPYGWSDRRTASVGDIGVAQCSHCDQGLDCGQPLCQPLPAIAGVVAGEQFRAGRNKHAAGVIHSDLPHHHVKLGGRPRSRRTQCSPPSSLRYRAALAPWRQLEADPPQRRYRACLDAAATPPAASYNGVPGRS